MTPINDLLGKHTTDKSTYTSCIKIGGIPILPPLVTLEKQIELQEYKKKAIDIERRLKCQRHLKLVIEQLPDSSNTKISNNTKRVTRTLENLLTFISDDPHIDALNITDTQPLPSEDCNKSVPLLDQNRKPSKLTCNIFDVTQYSDDGVVLFNEYNQSGLLSTTASTSEKLYASIVELDLTSVSGTDNSKDIMCNNSKKITESTKESNVSTETLNVTPPDGSKPRLLRSNSYTLEAPSPILVEHFKKQAELDPAFDKYLGQKRRSLDLGNSSCEICTALNTEKKKSVSSIDLNYFTTNDTDDTLKGCDIPIENVSELVEDLAVLHFGTNKSDLSSHQNVEKHEETEPKLSEDIEKNTETLQRDDMPKACAKDILDFLDRHTLEQELKLESYANFKQQLLDQNVTLPQHNDAPELHQESQQLQHDQSEKDILYFDEESRSCTINYLTSPNDTILNTSNPLLIDFESDSEPVIFFDCKSNHYEVGSEQLDLLTGPKEYQRSSTSLRHSRNANCSRELFAERPDKVQQRLKEQWAGTILTAAARGYLVRRLKRTERAKYLIQTIRDAVVCAMGLHTEDAEAIQPSDVELHRRLIQQISAACYEFYNIFFGLTLKEQMAMIAMDRQKLQEKLKRPSSSSSLKSDSSKSTSRVQNRSFSARQRKSLTPSFAA